MSPKRAAFVAEYLITLNATDAARKAGYKAKRLDQQGYALLRIDEVAKAIAKAQAERAARVEITQDYVIKRLMIEAEREDKDSSHGARVSALGLLGKHVGAFEKDNAQIRENIRVEVILLG